MTMPTVVILAAGENSRFFPLNTSTHKGALTLLGKPLVIRTIESLEKAGFTHVVIVVSPKDYDGKGLSGSLAEYQSPMRIDFVLQPEAKGMGNAVLCAKQYLSHSFGVVFPTTLDAGDVLSSLVDQAKVGGAMRVSYTKEPWLYGIVTVEDGKIISIVEKPEQGTEPSNLKAHEMYYLSHEFLAFLEQTKESEYAFEEALDKYFKVFDVTAVEQTQALPSLKFPWHLFDFQSSLFKTLPSYVSPMAKVAKTADIDETEGPVYIENGATIGHCARIVGPAFVGENAVVGDFSIVRQASIEKDAKVGAHSDIARSILMEGAVLHNGFIGDSIVGPRAQIGAGFLTSNLRLDRGTIQVDVKKMHVDTKRRKFGTVIGEAANVGINVMTMPGKFIGTHTIIYPGASIFEHIPHHATVKVKHSVEIVSQ